MALAEWFPGPPSRGLHFFTEGLGSSTKTVSQALYSLTQRRLFRLSWLLILSAENRAAVSCLLTVFDALRFGLLWSHCECVIRP